MFDHDTLNIRRSELLHHKWADRVYDPIRRHILSEISGKDFENLLLHKRLLYNAFLEKGNRKVVGLLVYLVTEGLIGRVFGVLLEQILFLLFFITPNRLIY